jgi:hypothetical protein
LAVQVFKRPAVFDEIGRKPVEQFRVSGDGTLKTKVVFRLYQTPTKIARPDAIYQHAGCERISGGNKPAGKIQTRCKPLIDSGRIKRLPALPAAADHVLDPESESRRG